MVVNVAVILPQELTLWQVGSRLKQMDFQKRKNKESVSECHRRSSLSRQMAASKPASVKLVWNKEVFFLVWFRSLNRVAQLESWWDSIFTLFYSLCLEWL